jgi:hypothetical protein
MTADFDKTHGFKELGADAVLSTWFSSVNWVLTVQHSCRYMVTSLL